MPNPLPESTLAELERLAKKARAAQMAYSKDPSELNGWRMRQVIAVLGQEYDAIDALVANVRALDKSLYAAYDAMCEGRNKKAFEILEAAVGERSDKSTAARAAKERT